MKWNNSNFTGHYRRVRIEGFGPDRFIDQCSQKGIQFRDLRMVSGLEATATVTKEDFRRLKKLAKNTYKLTILKDGGYKHTTKQIWKRKVTIIGVAIFIAFIYYQSLFIAEIRIDGYERLNEPELRRAMAAYGLYEGCSKKVDIAGLKLKMYSEFDEIAWMRIEFTGRMARVQIVEGEKKIPSKVAKGKPCHIVADRDGYIHRIIPAQGQRVREDGDYVRKGQILITGKVPLQNVAYGTETEGQTETYVHAAGTVQAKVPVRLHFFAEKYRLEKRKTGRRLVGVRINGHNSAKAMNRYETCVSKTKNILTIVKPIPLKIDVVVLEEVELHQKAIDGQNLKRAVEAEIRQYVKKNLPKQTQILNKSLNFAEEKNIMNVGVTLETLQTIGKEREIVIDKTEKGTKKDQDQRGN